MYRSSFAFGFVATVLLVGIAQAEPPKKDFETVTVPLDKIWAYNMPGTRDIQDLCKKDEPAKGQSLFARLTEASVLRMDKLKGKPTPRPGFAVVGSDLEALRGAHAVLAEAKESRSDFPSDSEITLVFFSEPISAHVHVRKVDRHGSDIEISYALDPYVERRVSTAFAMIPVGKLPDGTFKVSMRPLGRTKLLEYEDKDRDERWGRDYVCKSFSFVVGSKGR